MLPLIKRLSFEYDYSEHEIPNGLYSCAPSLVRMLTRVRNSGRLLSISHTRIAHTNTHLIEISWGASDGIRFGASITDFPNISAEKPYTVYLAN